MGDEKIYQRVQDELDGKPRKFTDKALMTKAEILCEGDQTKIKYMYIKLRVEKLKKEEEERLKREEIKEKERVLKDNERIELEKQKAKKFSNNVKVWLSIIGFVILARIISVNLSNLFS